MSVPTPPLPPSVPSSTPSTPPPGAALGCGTGSTLAALVQAALDGGAYYCAGWLSLADAPVADLDAMGAAASQKEDALDTATQPPAGEVIATPANTDWGDLVYEDDETPGVYYDNAYAYLNPGASGAWDEYLELADAPVGLVLWNGQLRLYYLGAEGLRVNASTGPADQGPRYLSFGLASSTDNGLTWTKHASNPLLVHRPYDAEAEGFAGGCLVDAGSSLWFYGAATTVQGADPLTASVHYTITLSKSTDGVTWSEPAQIVTSSVWGGDGNLVPRGGFVYAGKVHLYYTSHGGARNHQLGYMRLSSDGFEVEASAPIFTDNAGYGACVVLPRSDTAIALAVGIRANGQYRVYEVQKPEPATLSSVLATWDAASVRLALGVYYNAAIPEWYRFELGQHSTDRFVGFTTGEVAAPLPPLPPDPPPPTPDTGVGDDSVEFVAASFDIPESARTSKVVRLRRRGSSSGRVVALVTWENGTAIKKRNYDYFDRYVVWEDGDATDKYLELDVFIDTRRTSAVSLTCTITSLPANPGSVFEIGPQASCTINLTKVVGSRGVTQTSFANLGGAISNAQPGDIIEVIDGTYTTGGFTLASAAGTASDQIVVRAQTVGGVEIGNGGNNVTIAVGGSAAPYWILDGFVLRDIPNGSPVNIDGNWSRVQNCTFINCGGDANKPAVKFRGEVSDAGLEKSTLNHSSGVVLDGAGTANKDRNWMYYCYFHNGNNGGGSGNLDYLQDATQRNTDGYQTRMHRCLWDHWNAQNLSEAWSLKSADPIIRYTTTRNCGDRLNWRTPRRVLAHHSFFLDGSGNIGFMGDGHKVYACYLDGKKSGGSHQDSRNIHAPAAADEPGEIPSDTVIWRQENIDFAFTDFMYPDGENMYLNEGWGGNFDGRIKNKEARAWTVKACLYVRSSTAANMMQDDYDSLSSGKIAFSECVAYASGGNYGETPTSGITRTDPNLSNDSNLHMYRPSASSSALIGQATPHSNPICKRDIFMRPRDPATPDVGCEEYLDENTWPKVNLPLQPSDVGPENT